MMLKNSTVKSAAAARPHRADRLPRFVGSSVFIFLFSRLTLMFSFLMQFDI